MSKKDLGAFIWVSLLSGVLGTILYTAALGKINYIQFSVVVLLQQLQPIFVILFALIVLKEKITSSYLFWTFFALLGAYLLSFPSLKINLSNDFQTIEASLMAIGAAFCWGSSTAFSKYALKKFNYIHATGIRFLLTIPISFLFVYLLNDQSSLTTISSSQILKLLLISLSTGMVAMVIYYRGLKYTPAKVSAIAELFWPFSAVIIGYFFLKENLTISQLLGATLILLSINRITKKNEIIN